MSKNLNTIGFPISHKENENRRALIPEHLEFVEHPEALYFEYGYGNVLGIADEEFAKQGCHIVSREDVLRQDIICDPKVGDAEYLDDLKPGQSIFGWVHATQNRDITDKILKSRLTAYAWEDMYYMGRHIFWRNNELAGEAAVMHAFQCYGKMPYETDVAVIGRGNTARGAVKILNMLGANVMQYNQSMEALLREEIGKYDVIVNCILWDVTREDHIIYKEDLKRMKKNSMIIDVSCDRNGGIETCVPTTIENPVYHVDGVLHYAVDHTPAIFYQTFSRDNSLTIIPYLNEFVNCSIGEVLTNCVVIRDGVIVDENINLYQNR
jgi:N5-(carboxyethyl)ornithine synthase